jgi:hypothetical protein
MYIRTISLPETGEAGRMDGYILIEELNLVIHKYPTPSHLLSFPPFTPSTRPCSSILSTVHAHHVVHNNDLHIRIYLPVPCPPNLHRSLETLGHLGPSLPGFTYRPHPGDRHRVQGGRPTERDVGSGGQGR